MKFCPECGSPIKGKEEYCGCCGYRIPEEMRDYTSVAEEDPRLNEITPEQTEDRKILIDYFERIVGTPTPMPYHEIVLYAYSEKELLMEEYLEGGSTRERCIRRLVPRQAYADALEVVERFHLKKLLDRRGSPMKGKKYLIRFRLNEEEELYRFSSDNVGAEETMMMFPEMLKALSKYR